jgi:hypothetical protein
MSDRTDVEMDPDEGPLLRPVRTDFGAGPAGSRAYTAALGIYTDEVAILATETATLAEEARIEMERNATDLEAEGADNTPLRPCMYGSCIVEASINVQMRHNLRM